MYLKWLIAGKQEASIQALYCPRRKHAPSFRPEWGSIIMMQHAMKSLREFFLRLWNYRLLWFFVGVLCWGNLDGVLGEPEPHFGQLNDGHIRSRKSVKNSHFNRVSLKLWNQSFNNINVLKLWTEIFTNTFSFKLVLQNFLCIFVVCHYRVKLKLW